MPLNALLTEQCDKLSRITGCRPFVLNGDSESPENIQAIREGRFTHVFTSPEIAIKTEFKDNVLRDSTFSSQLCLLAIDEVHLVNEWKIFRPAYFGLKVLRTRIPPWVPLLGVSATLNSHTLEIIRERCDFNEDTVIIKTPLDRPEIYLQVSSIRCPMNSMLDLQYLLPLHVTRAQDIPKTIVFMDSIADIVAAARLMRLWMRQLAYPIDIDPLVSPFFAAMAERDKIALQRTFGLPTNECLSPRIIIASDAYGMGVDNRDIQRVVQWLIPPSIEKLYQRMGRAMRCGRGQANFTWLHPPWCVGPKSAVASIETRANYADADRRARMAPGIYDIINMPGEGCIRRVGLDYFDDEEHRQGDWTKPVPCCSGCDTESQISILPHTALNKLPEENSLSRPWFTSKLEAWRVQRAETAFGTGYLRFFPSLIMPDEVLTRLAIWGEYIQDEASMRRWVGNGWAGLPDYCAEILRILQQGQALEKDRGEVFDAWALRNDIKRGRCPNPMFNEEQANFDARRASWMIEKGQKVVNKVNTKRARGVAKTVERRERESKNKDEASQEKIVESRISEVSTEGNPDQVNKNQAVSGVTPNAGQVKGKGISKKVPATPRRTRQPLQELLVNKSVEVLSPTRSRQCRRLPARYQDN